jgi:hypothetical protein
MQASNAHFEHFERRDWRSRSQQPFNIANITDGLSGAFERNIDKCQTNAQARLFADSPEHGLFISSLVARLIDS